MLFQGKETAMYTITFKRMVTGEYHQFFCIMGRYVCYRGNQFIGGLAITIGFARGAVSPKVMMFTCLLSVWNLYLGTIVSAIQLVLLVVLLLA